jgi:hypothetical protein
MAESWRAKAKRYARGEFTNTELKIMVGGLLFDQVIDVATFGRLSQLKGKILQRAVIPLLTRAVPRAGLSVGGAALGASRILMTNPYVLGATAIYVGVTERERIKQLLDQGYQIIKEDVAPPVSEFLREEVFTRENLERARDRGQIGPAPIPAFLEKFRPTKRRPSSFNKAIKAGMKAVKKSKSYGGIGKISPATKVFTLVTKLASAKKKKKKAPKSGIRRKIWGAMKGLR